MRPAFAIAKERASGQVAIHVSSLFDEPRDVRTDETVIVAYFDDTWHELTCDIVWEVERRGAPYMYILQRYPTVNELPCAILATARPKGVFNPDTLKQELIYEEVQLFYHFTPVAKWSQKNLFVGPIKLQPQGIIEFGAARYMPGDAIAIHTGEFVLLRDQGMPNAHLIQNPYKVPFATNCDIKEDFDKPYGYVLAYVDDAWQSIFCSHQKPRSTDGAALVVVIAIIGLFWWIVAG